MLVGQSAPDPAELDSMISAGRFFYKSQSAPLIVLKSGDFKDNEYGHSHRLTEQVINVGKSNKHISSI